AGKADGTAAPPAPEIAPPQPVRPENTSSTDQTLPSVSPTPTAPAAVLAFRTEQIYLCDADGDQLRPLTQSEGKIYFYYVWSPDSSMLAALVTTSPEWKSMLGLVPKGEVFQPAGRPHVVEKN